MKNVKMKLVIILMVPDGLSVFGKDVIAGQDQEIHFISPITFL